MSRIVFLSVIFICIHLSIPSKNVDFERQPSLGRIVNLGSVYYAADERLAFDEALWKLSTIQTKSTKQDISYSTSKLKFIQSLADRFELFEIGAKVTLGLLSGLIEISGSIGYLRDDTTQTEQSKILLTYKSITSTEYISQDMRNSLDFEEVCESMYDKENPATHIVSSITRGFQGNSHLYSTFSPNV